jgi:hypothetical protein
MYKHNLAQSAQCLISFSEHGQTTNYLQLPKPTRPNRPREDENEPGRNSTNPRSVPRETGERGHFARRQPGSQMGQVNQTGRPASHGLRPPPALYIKRIPTDQGRGRSGQRKGKCNSFSETAIRSSDAEQDRRSSTSPAALARE